MAAGLASRYGSAKQVEGMGPNGEILLEYSMMDAARAGFERVVFIIRPELRPVLEGIVQARHRGRMEVCYAVQDFSSVPARVPAARVKPYGTVHAALCARPWVDGPFAVLNADDYYGTEAFRLMHDFLTGDHAPDCAAMVGYRLASTVSRHGGVTRAICLGEDGWLSAAREVRDVRLRADGRIARMEEDREVETLDPDALVSMNFWGFDACQMAAMDEAFRAFLGSLAPDELKREYLLPVFVDEQIRAGRLKVRILPTGDHWFGMTYPEDRPRVMEELRKLHAAGAY